MLSIRSINTSEQEILIATINQPAHEALRLLLADGIPAVGLGKTFWCVGHFLYYENCRFSVTKSQKIDPKVRNPPSRRGLQTGHWRSPGSYSKKRIFGPKPKVLGPKNTSQFNPCSSHYRAKLCKEKSTLLPNKYHYFSGFRVSFLGTNRPCRLIWYPVGWLVGGCGEGCISQDTYLLYYSNH